MPDIGRPNEPPDQITREAFAKGGYELQPMITPGAAHQVVKAKDPDEPPTIKVESPKPARADMETIKARIRELPRLDGAEGPAEALDWSDDDDRPADAERPPAPTAASASADLEPTPPPPHRVRMISDDPTINVDGFERHPAGGLWVPISRIDELRPHGFYVQHEHEIPDEP
jgi:hypothetical protein